MGKAKKSKKRSSLSSSNPYYRHNTGEDLPSMEMDLEATFMRARNFVKISETR
jgi:hypothetical protein